MIRMGKDKKDRNKDWTLCNVFIMLTQYGVSEKKNGSIFSLQFLLESSPPCSFCNKVTFIDSGYFHGTVPFTYQYCSFSFSQVTGFSCHIRLYRHLTFGLLSNYIRTQDLIVNYNFHHSVTQDPVFHYTMYFIMQQLNIVLSIIFSSCGNS